MIQIIEKKGSSLINFNHVEKAFRDVEKTANGRIMKNMNKGKGDNPRSRDPNFKVELSDDDIYGAMKDIGSYLDITSKDFKEIYRLAFRHAVERITTSVKARDIMTKGVFFVRRETPLNEVAGLMAEKSVSGVPVLDNDNKVIGVISEKDFLSNMGVTDTRHFMSVIMACLKGKECIAEPMMTKKAGEIMASPVVTVHEDTSLMEIADIFTEKNINRVPVVDSDGCIKGIVSRADIIRANIGKRP